MPSKPTIQPGAIRLFLLILILYTSGSVFADNISPGDLKGTWRSQKNELELDESGNFQFSEGTGLVPFMFKGDWHLSETTLELKVHSGKALGQPAIQLTDEEFSFPVNISRTEEGEIILVLDKISHRKISDQTTFPFEWEKDTDEERNDKPIDSWFIRPLIFPFPRVNINVEPGENDSLSFQIVGSRNVTGFYQIDIWQPEDESPRWSARLNHNTRKKKLVYGGPLEAPARQLFPEDPETPPRPLNRNRPFFVQLEVSYRLIFPPSLGMDPMVYKFEFTENGKMQIREILP